jgi:hypothetical protein
MELEQQIKQLEETRAAVVKLTENLDSQLSHNAIPGIEYKLILHEKLGGKSKEEVLSFLDHKIAQLKDERDTAAALETRKRQIIKIGAVVVLIALVLMIGLVVTEPHALTGFVTHTP